MPVMLDQSLDETSSESPCSSLDASRTDSESTSEVFSGLPTELLIHVFILAASSSLKATRTLSHVSRWTRELVKPYMFSTVILKDDHDAARLQSYYDVFSNGQQFIDMDPYLRDFGRLDDIRNVWDEHSYISRAIPSLVQMENLVSLAVSEVSFFVFVSALAKKLDKELESSTTISIHNLYILIHGDGIHWYRLKDLFPESELPCASKALDMITHLRFLHPHSVMRSLDTFTLFSHLTHVAFPFELDQLFGDLRWGFEDAAAKLPKSLQLVVFVFSDDTEPRTSVFVPWMLEIRRKDRRVNIVVVDLANAHEDWKAEVEEGESIWKKAINQTWEWEVAMQNHRGY